VILLCKAIKVQSGGVWAVGWPWDYSGLVSDMTSGVSRGQQQIIGVIRGQADQVPGGSTQGLQATDAMHNKVHDRRLCGELLCYY
jgi:hypothetical protein